MSNATPRALRIVVVGGGSTYTPELADGIARLRESLPVKELILVDPDLARARVVAGLSARILAAAGSDCTVEATTGLEDAAVGADAVLLQLRVGGQAARARDEAWPLECGCIGQETTGAGGLAKALRTIPVVLDIAARVRDVNPDAWIVNFTNPVGMVTRALLDAGHRAVGLCNVAIGFERLFAAELGVAPEAVELDHVGLNHLSWELGARVRHGDGTATEVLDRLLDEHGEALVRETELPLELLRTERFIPSYYLRYYLAHDALVEHARTAPSRALEVAAIESELLARYADPELAEKPAQLAQRGGAYYSEAAIGLLSSLLGTGAVRDHIVNVRNRGTLPFLDAEAIIETRVEVGPGTLRVRAVPPVPALASGLIAHVARYEELGVDAAIHGGRDRVVRALLAHPLIGQYETAQALADTLITENLEWLPWAR
ncbi:6-phospho-beta-glucosidase [Microbacterium sp. CFBP9034]|uniref:family 4 glycosyl hydrolase n=1 Tax=Microbacterium sp. CFBP9034 TaxID=3096540 RepID=UPI002A6AA7A8|nr:6-phospho-beta-glucosidase [Microbacterium sp. CFBP9034]MDY0908504.1 6-phospho-beta-glucosidase [Microbacterium sp. CFBP9034]